MEETQKCTRCEIEIPKSVVPNRIKTVGKETRWQWFWRHVRQFFSLIRRRFIKPEIEGHENLCDDCYDELQIWLHTKE